MNDFIVTINNITFSDFDYICVKKSMDELAGYMEFSTANFYRQAQGKWDIFLEDEFECSINKIKQLSGVIDDIRLEYSDKGESVTIIGRDKTALLVDSDWNESTNEWKKQTILSIINDLCSYFEIDVTVDSSVSSVTSNKIESFKINEGEQVFNAIKRLCIENGILPLSYGDNKLTLTAVSTTRTSKENIELGGNILNGIIHHSNVNRFNSYVVKGYGKETDFNQPLDYLQPMGTATDSVIKNTKRKIVHLSDAEIDSGTASNQAKFIRNFSAGKSRPLRYRIRDWKQANGELWKINSLAQIKDTYAKISGKQMLISDLEFMYTEEEGYYTDITVVDKNTYTTSDELIKSGFDR